MTPGPILVASTAAIEPSNHQTRRRTRISAQWSGLIGAGLSFQPSAEASAPWFGSALSSFADHQSAMLTGLREDAHQARDAFNPSLHRHPHFVANPEVVEFANLPVTEDI